MLSIEDKLNSLPKSIKSIEKKLGELELSKSDIDIIQKKLDNLDDVISNRKYPISPNQVVDMLELQALIDYASGDLNSSRKLIKEALITESSPQFVSKLAKSIADDIGLLIVDGGKEPSKKNDKIPHYFTVSTFRLLFLGLASAGLYIIYWSYKNWKIIQAHEIKMTGKKKTYLPFLSSVFFILTSYSLFDNVRDSMKEVDKDRKVGAGAAAWAVFFLNQVCLVAIPVLVMQNHMNHIKTKAFGAPVVKKGFSGGEVVFIIVGLMWGGLFLLGLIASVNSSDTSYLTPEAEAQKTIMDNLTTEYDTCSDNLIVREKTLNKYSQSAVDSYNTDYDSCESVRLRQNAAVEKYNSLIGL